MRAARGEILRMQAGIKAWVLKGSSGTGRGLREAAPPMLLSLLCAAAFCPLIVPVAGVAGVASAGLGVLSTVGGGVLAEVVLSAIERLRAAGDPDKSDTTGLEAGVARHIELALEAGDANARALRAEIAAVLQEIDAHATLLRAGIEAGNEEIRRDVATVIEVIGAGFSELGFGIVEIDRKAAEIQKSVDALAEERRADSDRLAQHGTQIRLLREDFAAFTRRYSVGVTSAAGIELAPRWAHGCPYLGLVPFDEEHAEVFYGRAALTADLARKVSGHLDRGGPVVVTGASGVGKSSLLHAGLVPALADGRQIEGSAQWPCIVMRPTNDPMAELARRMAVLIGTDTSAFTIREQLARFPAQAGDIVWDALLAHAARTNGSKQLAIENTLRLVLIVDQFEEVFTVGANPSDESGRHAFITALCSAAASPAGSNAHPAALVIIAVRGDFWGHCETYPELARELENGRFAVLPMTETGLRLAITGPADAARLHIDAGLTETILADLRAIGGDAPVGALPLLSQAMLLTWQNRAGDRLTSHGYDKTGGVRQAVQTSANHVYNSLSAEQQILAQQMLRSMTVVGRSGKLTSREVTRADLYQGKDRGQVDAVLSAFADKRLVVLDSGSVRVAHEALIEGWERLHEWVEPDVEFQYWLSVTRVQVRTWESFGRDEGSLLRGEALKDAKYWCSERGGEIELGVKEFIIRSGIQDGSFLIGDIMPAGTALELSREFDDSQLLGQVLDEVIKYYIHNGEPILASAYWKERWSLLQPIYPKRKKRWSLLPPMYRKWKARLDRASDLLSEYGNYMPAKLSAYCVAGIVAPLVAAGLVLAPLIAGQYGVFGAVVATVIAVTALVWYRSAPLLRAKQSIRTNDRLLKFEWYNRIGHAVWPLPFAVAAGAIMASLLITGLAFRVLWTSLAAVGLCVEIALLFVWARSERKSLSVISDPPVVHASDQVSPDPQRASLSSARRSSQL